MAFLNSDKFMQKECRQKTLKCVIIVFFVVLATSGCIALSYAIYMLAKQLHFCRDQRHKIEASIMLCGGAISFIVSIIGIILTCRGRNLKRLRVYLFTVFLTILLYFIAIIVCKEHEKTERNNIDLSGTWLSFQNYYKIESDKKCYDFLQKNEFCCGFINAPSVILWTDYHKNKTFPESCRCSEKHGDLALSHYFKYEKYDDLACHVIKQNKKIYVLWKQSCDVAMAKYYSRINHPLIIICSIFIALLIIHLIVTMIVSWWLLHFSTVDIYQVNYDVTDDEISYRKSYHISLYDQQLARKKEREETEPNAVPSVFTTGNGDINTVSETVCDNNSNNVIVNSNRNAQNNFAFQNDEESSSEDNISLSGSVMSKNNLYPMPNSDGAV